MLVKILLAAAFVSFVLAYVDGQVGSACLSPHLAVYYIDDSTARPATVTLQEKAAALSQSAATFEPRCSRKSC